MKLTPAMSEPLSDRFDRDIRPALMAFFVRRVGNRTEAEDLTQDVYLRLLHGRVTGVGDDLAYVFKIAMNLLRDKARREQVRTRYATSISNDVWREADTLDPHRIAAGREALRTLVSALQSLPERTRQIFLLVRYERMSHAAIADTFGISVSAVEKHVQRAIARLAGELEQGQ